MGVAASNLIPSGRPLGAITTIRDHENAHVKFLKQVLGDKAVSKPTFDFTAGELLPMYLVIMILFWL